MSRIGSDEFIDSVKKNLPSAVNVGALFGGFEELRKRILHQVVLRFGLRLRAEEAGVHHPAIDAACDGEWSDTCLTLQRDARAEGMLFVADNDALLRAGKAEGRGLFERMP